MFLQSAKGPVPNVADLVAGETVKGSWWGHPAGHQIFAVLNELDESPNVVRLRLVKGKVTLVHRQRWPALVRLADRFPPDRLAALHEEHTESGRHRVEEAAVPGLGPRGRADRGRTAHRRRGGGPARPAPLNLAESGRGVGGHLLEHGLHLLVDQVHGLQGRIMTRNSTMRPSALQRMMSTPLTYLPAIVVSNSRPAVSRSRTCCVWRIASPRLYLPSSASPGNVWLAACR